MRPTLESVLTSADIIGIGAQAALLVFNIEVGFSRTNIDSLCDIGRSAKKSRRHQGFIGEKGRVIKEEQEVPRLHQINSKRGRAICAIRTPGTLGRTDDTSLLPQMDGFLKAESGCSRHPRCIK